MALLFTIITLAFVATLARLRPLALSLAVISLGLTVLMFWHHVTDTLKINW